MHAGARVARAAASRLRQPVVLTLLLTLAVAGAGAALTGHVPPAALLDGPDGAPLLLVAVGLAVAFFVTELGQALVEVRRQAYSFSLSGVPLLLGVLYLPPTALLVARLVGALCAFAVQRASPVKAAFNSASYLLDTALVLALTGALLPGPGTLTLRTAALCYVALAVVDLLMSLLVLLVIRIHQGPVTVAEVVEVLGPAAAFVLLNTAVALITASLLSDGLLGAVLLSLFVVVTAGAYRGFLVLRARHQSLQVVQDFVEHGEGAGSVEELAQGLLDRLRSLLRASRVELTLLEDGDAQALHVRADEHGIDVTRADGAALDRLLARALEDGTPLLLGPRDTGLPAAWLHARGVADALVVPLSRSGARGVVVALDRVGEATAFTRDDLALLQTLSGHLAVALHSRRLVQRLLREATHDALTGLPNRALLLERLQHALVAPHSGPPAVLLLDLDRFKEVNDALGHHVGDALLQVVAERVRGAVRGDATVARLGGDEFAVLLPGAAGDRDDPRAHAAAQAAAVTVAERVSQALSAPVQLPDVVVSTGASTGIAVAGPGQAHTDLLRHADTAMYAAKAAGAPVTVFSPALDVGRAERLALLADLHLALERDELELQYQPKLHLASGTATAVEALVRWQHPVLGRLSPDAFVPLAESTGLVEQLTATVLSLAVRQARSWLDDGVDVTVAVNLSARNVNNAALPDLVAATLAAHDLPADRLVLEITESSLLGDVERTVPTLHRLAATGVALSLDDFGTGYSSLSYLQRLPVHELKVDRSFVKGLDATPAGRTSELLVRSIIGLAHGLGLRVVAEGVEDADVLDHLRELGCDLAQGYHLSRPVPAPELPAVLRRLARPLALPVQTGVRSR